MTARELLSSICAAGAFILLAVSVVAAILQL